MEKKTVMLVGTLGLIASLVVAYNSKNPPGGCHYPTDPCWYHPLPTSVTMMTNQKVYAYASAVAFGGLLMGGILSDGKK